MLSSSTFNFVVTLKDTYGDMEWVQLNFTVTIFITTVVMPIMK